MNGHVQVKESETSAGLSVPRNPVQQPRRCVNLAGCSRSSPCRLCGEFFSLILAGLGLGAFIVLAIIGFITVAGMYGN